MDSEKLLLLFAPSSLDLDNEEDVRLAITYLLSTFIGAVIFFTYGIAYYYILNSKYILVSNIIWSLLLMSSTLFFKRGASILFVTNFAALIIFLGINNVTLCLGRETTMGIYFLNIIPLSIGLYLSMKQFLFWTVLCALSFPFQATIGKYYLSFLEIPLTEEFKNQLWDSSYFVNLFIIALFVYIYMTTLNKSLNSLKEKSESAHSLVRVLTHDIGNPLTIIKNSTKMISEKKLDSDKLKKYALKSYKASQMIENIADQVKTLEAMESGKKKLTLSSISLNSTIQEVLHIFEDKLKEKQINIKFDNYIESHILAEPISLTHQVLSNIISNAIKFTDPQGEIRISIENTDDKIKLVVKDSGIGIPESLLKNIFSKNASTSRQGTSGEKGTGFGMPILKDYMTYYKGDVEILSQDINNFPNEHGTSIILLFNQPS